MGTRSSAPFQQLMNLLPGFQFVYAQGGYSQGKYGNLWIPDPPTKNEPTTSATVAAASLHILDDIVRTQGPFYGILGYSQGSAFVPVYLSHAPANTFQVAMMYCYLTTTYQGLLGLVNATSPFNNISSLVYMGGRDTTITNAMTDAQAAKFTDPVRLLDANAGHGLPLTTSPTFAKVISFVNNNTATAAHQGKDSLARYPPVHPPAATPAYDDSSTSVTPFKMSVPLIGAVVALFLF